ncbi:YlbL family protein [Fodinicola acaciae]|uniref:YlbL family protein n=1 Tax=Fodinicola acaciae TaxID=2681555 RepID=UPI0013D185D9|nr:PDZ domain-containing protein [Fodinicola acaciae]
MRRGWTVLTGALVLIALGIGLARLPVPYVAEAPGPTIDTLGKANGKQIIQITGRATTKPKGHLNLTTVSAIDQIDLGTAIRFWIDGDTAVLPREFVYPPDQSRKQIEARNADDFTQSQTSAETAALREIGYPVIVKVESLSAGSPSTGKLAAGDVLTTVDGKQITSNGFLQRTLQAHQPGDTVRIGYLRGNAPATATVKLGADDQRHPILGVRLNQSQPHPFTVTIQLSDIGGPSAGLMFALGIIDLTTADDLTNGKFIAGTGTIDDDGTVGVIGGIQQKMIAARKAGATVFLVPAGNCEEASGAAPAGLRLVKIDTLHGAVTALATLRRNGPVPAC